MLGYNNNNNTQGSLDTLSKADFFCLGSYYIGGANIYARHLVLSWGSGCDYFGLFDGERGHKADRAGSVNNLQMLPSCAPFSLTLFIMFASTVITSSSLL